MQLRFLPLVLTLAVLACGPGQQVAGPPADDGSPKSGGVLRFNRALDPFDWDPTYNGIVTPNNVGVLLAYNTLLDFKSGPDIEHSAALVAPGLAERWEVSPDAKTFTFRLKKGVRWADLPPLNGRELTAGDVQWSFEYQSRAGAFADAKLPKSYVDWAYTGMDKVEAPDGHTVTVHFKEPYGAFLGISAAGMYAAVLPKELYQRDGHMKDHLVGSGPFQIDPAASQKGTRWVFKRNPTYFQQGRPYLEEVRWIILPQEATAIAALQTQQIDLLSDGVSYDTAEAIRKNDPRAVMYRFLEPAPLQMFLQTKRPPTDDVRVRRAIALSINRDEFIKVFSNGQGAWGLSGAIAGLFSDQELRQLMKHDQEEAKRLLQQAGYPGGLTLDHPIAPERGERYVKENELLQAQLRKIGINLTLRTVAREDQSRAFRNGEFQTTTVPNARFAGDISDWVFSLYLPGSVQNFNRVDDARLTGMLAALQAETDPDRRKQAIRDAARYVYDNVFGLAIYHGSDYFFWSPRLKGYTPNYWRRERGFVDAWLE